MPSFLMRDAASTISKIDNDDFIDDDDDFLEYDNAVGTNDSFDRYVFQFLLVFFPKVADQVLTEQVSLG